ncbi:hypothetical protein IKG33_01605 [Candidatus Saccharibacteria bacterium]|nr:hypothetical protein [Candidatus Saccharibacteria bacterium]
MKKIIVAGAASVLAFLPTVGAFAATGTTVTDTIEVTINAACSITATSLTNTYSETMTNSQLKSDIGGTSMTIACNDAAGWKVTAVGSGTATNVTQMKATGSGTNIATGTATSGATSNWAFKVTGTNASGYTTFKAVPSTAATVATSAGAVTGNAITATYQVWISATQQADTYTGKVTYTLVHPA